MYIAALAQAQLALPAGGYSVAHHVSRLVSFQPPG